MANKGGRVDLGYNNDTLANQINAERLGAVFVGPPAETVSMRDGVEFITIHWHGTAYTKFTSRTESTADVLQTVAKFCNELAGGIGCFDFRVRFNVAAGPYDYVCGEIEWVGF